MTVGFIEYRLAGLDEQLISIYYQGLHVFFFLLLSPQLILLLVDNIIGILIKDHQKGAGYSGL